MTSQLSDDFSAIMFAAIQSGEGDEFSRDGRDVELDVDWCYLEKPFERLTVRDHTTTSSTSTKIALGQRHGIT